MSVVQTQNEVSNFKESIVLHCDVLLVPWWLCLVIIKNSLIIYIIYHKPELDEVKSLDALKLIYTVVQKFGI